VRLYRSVRAYEKVIREVYSISYRLSKHNESRTRKVEAKLLELGIDFDIYMEIAVSLYIDFAKLQGWKYPYWTVVTGDKAIARIRELVSYADMLDDDDGADIGLLYVEIAFLDDYIDWYTGRSVDGKPFRGYAVSSKLQSVAAHYVCDVYGIPFISSDYNYIARRIHDSKSRSY